MGRKRASLLLRRAAILGALAGVLLLAFGSPASADSPCWKRVTLDWADNGVVDKTYPLPCYQQAINHATTDVSMYSSFVDDVQRARQRAIADRHGNGGAVTIAPDTASSSDGGVPTPLLVLGGLAIVLVAVGAVGVFRRRGRGAS
jgi:predicted alpha/beta-hydrolase family hydrolase